MFWLIPVEWGIPLGHSPWGRPGSQRSLSPLPLSTTARQTVWRYRSEFRKRLSVDEVEQLVWSSSAHHWYQLLPSFEILKQNRRNGYIMLDRSHTSDGCMIRWQSTEFLNHRLYINLSMCELTVFLLWPLPAIHTVAIKMASIVRIKAAGLLQRYCSTANMASWWLWLMHTCDGVHSAISA